MQTGIYRHYKGGIYELIGEATHEADMRTVVLYRAHDGRLWTRDKEVFFEKIVIDGQTVDRFAIVETKSYALTAE